MFGSMPFKRRKPMIPKKQFSKDLIEKELVELNKSLQYKKTLVDPGVEKHIFYLSGYLLMKTKILKSIRTFLSFLNFFVLKITHHWFNLVKNLQILYYFV